MVHNLMEEVVRQCLKELIQTQKQLSGCDLKTQSDIMAIALNNLQPKYVSSSQGEMFVKTQARLFEPEVYKELSYAVEKVLNSQRKKDFPTDEE
jgi:competence protein ComFB